MPLPQKIRGHIPLNASGLRKASEGLPLTPVVGLQSGGVVHLHALVLCSHPVVFCVPLAKCRTIFSFPREETVDDNMAYFENESRELGLKLVYYGPPLSGKTTNLQNLHRFLKPTARGRLMKLDAADDRTLFCDFLPVFWNGPHGLRVKLNVYTVPGQFMHRTTRKLLLAETDGVIFVADSQVEEAQENENAWRSMKKKLMANGLDPEATPIVVQFNKNDLPAARGAKELALLQEGRSEPIYTAAALLGVGVLESFFACMRLVFRNACAQFELDKLGIYEGLLLKELANQLELNTAGTNLDEVVRSFAASADSSSEGIDNLLGLQKDLEP